MQDTEAAPGGRTVAAEGEGGTSAGPQSADAFNVAKNCGAQCVAVFLKQRGVAVPLEEVVSRCDRDGDGESSLDDLGEACRYYGFPCDPVYSANKAMTWDIGILRVHDAAPGNAARHFVLVQAEQEGYTVFIPPYGVGEWSGKELASKWDGYGLRLTANENGHLVFGVSVACLALLAAAWIALKRARGDSRSSFGGGRRGA